jgi:hypothetical protein
MRLCASEVVNVHIRHLLHQFRRFCSTLLYRLLLHLQSSSCGSFPNVGKQAFCAALQVAADARLFDDDNIVLILKVSNETRCEQ